MVEKLIVKFNFIIIKEARHQKLTMNVMKLPKSLTNCELSL